MTPAGFRKTRARIGEARVLAFGCIRLCYAMPAGSNSPTTGRIPERYSTTSDTGIFSTPRRDRLLEI
jgi:hypothetical protein